MRRPRPCGDEDRAVVISLVVVFGIIAGALAAVWIAGGEVEQIVEWFP